MSAVNLLASFREKPSDDTLKESSNHEGDEECSPKSLSAGLPAGVRGVAGGGGDPAVLAVGPVRQALTYTREELMRLRNSPLSKRALDPAQAACEKLALLLRKRSDSPNDDDRGGRGDAPNENHKGVYGRERDRERRSADPRERVRKESETSGSGIVLSPQRRSFTSGCGAPGAAAPPPPMARTRPQSPLSAAAANAPAQTNKTDAAGRRIGSGRLMVSNMANAAVWERGGGHHDERGSAPRDDRRMDDRRADDRPQQRQGNDRYDRRSFARDSYSSDIKREREERFNNEKQRDREDNRRSGNGRFTQRRFEKEDEPEWFSGGPTSKLETIELRGFDEPVKRNGTTNNNNKEDREKWNNNKESDSRSPERWRSESASQPSPPPPPPVQNGDDVANNSNDKDSGVESKASEEASTAEQPEFNLDAFLNFDTIDTDVLTNGTGDAEGGSRFSRWFRRESPTQDSKHYERLLHNIVDELDKPSVPEPKPVPVSEPQHSFAPIAPAPSLLELLRRANAQPTDMNAVNNSNHSGGKIHSLEELEARLRPQHPPAAAPPPDHDLAAFKRLLAQVSGGHAVTADPPQRPPPQQPPPPQPMSLLQMLNKSMEQQQQQKVQQQQQQQQQQQPHIPQELLYKLLQVQRQQHHQPDIPGPVPNTISAATERELLQRPEACAIIAGLKAGEITAAHLIQQLSNPGLQSRHRELLLTILRLHQHQHHRQMGGSPLPGSVPMGVPTAPHLVVPPHHQPLRLSPLPHTGVPARIPSPRELAAHTQSIMQNALIKKKLEEQRENYRRRHEQPKHHTPISFTPTSVLRKMTAEKESEPLSPKQQQWNQPPKMPQGRPIVKQGNQTGPVNYSHSPAEYQHFMNQQQMASGVRPFPHSQRQMPPSMSNMNNMTRGVPHGTTLHQLLVQSHQRSMNEMSGVGPSAGGGDNNQLARWFSPELLARASAGKLPSVHVPNALSLEELERAHHSPAVHN